MNTEHEVKLRGAILDDIANISGSYLDLDQQLIFTRSIPHLVAELNKHRGITKLSLCNNNLGIRNIGNAELKQLTGLQHIRELRLERNDIGFEVALALVSSEQLAGVKIKLDDNNLNDAEVLRLIPHVKQAELSITGLGITATTTKKLGKKLKENATKLQAEASPPRVTERQRSPEDGSGSAHCSGQLLQWLPGGEAKNPMPTPPSPPVF